MLYIHFLSSGKPPPSTSQNLNKFNDDIQDNLQPDYKASKKAIEFIHKLQQTYYLERKLFF
ncbi:hypothetical protein CEN46_24250 [Fischerella thermalis CCMEE 5318]|uniref:Uncharacterized protein n=1 Tax=Fischerella thermalis CCMEE 5318 TaxID=2019666 RepID=A0A2N6L5L1_9CYAN|nr:hypothetical protein CEN46_24250 [Fischerella thermalis CCMEE 5318]PMB19794.1 hypothetical protein CEN47_22770 [Fischerella thermalis CCMEE 5319]